MPVEIAANRLNVPILIVDDFDDGKDPNNLGGKVGLWKLDDHGYQGFSPLYDSENRVGDSGYGLKLSYDLASDRRALCAYSQFIEGENLTPYSNFSFYIKGDRAEGFTKRLKIEIWDIYNVEVIYFVRGITDEWQKVTIPLTEFKGILSRWDKPKRIAIVLENQPDFYKETCVTRTKGVIYIDNITFEK